MSNLIIQAGKRAIAHVREHGLSPNDISIVPGAAGGPKGLGLAKLDEWLFADWLPKSFATRTTPIDLIGSSIGAWRFSSVCCGHRNGVVSAEGTRAALDHFARNYVQQRYRKNVTPAEITASVRESVHELFATRAPDILTHPHYRLNVLVVRGKGILAREQRGRTQLGYTLAAAANASGRKHLRHFMDRIWFSPAAGKMGGETPPLAGTLEKNSSKMPTNRGVSSSLNRWPTQSGKNFDPFRTEYADITPANFADVLSATGAIPLVIESVTHIGGIGEGAYWDGGIIDYHLHLPYDTRKGLVLYPHFTDKIVPGWLDKMLPWRKAKGEWLDNVILISPSREYLDKLPLKKLPDRSDFKRFVNDYDARDEYWRFAIGESARLRDELAGLIEGGKLAERIVALS
jgi:hypothetical protein